MYVCVYIYIYTHNIYTYYIGDANVIPGLNEAVSTMKPGRPPASLRGDPVYMSCCNDLFYV